MESTRVKKIIAHLLVVLMLAVTFGTCAAVLTAEDAEAADTSSLFPGDYLYMGNTGVTHYTGLPLWRVIDKDSDGNLYLMSEYLWTSESDESFIQFGEVADTGVPMEGYEDQGYMSKGSAWQGSNAQVWCRGFEDEVLSGIDGLSIVETTKTDDEFTSPDPTESTTDAYIKYAWTKNILDGDKVFFLSAEEAARYMPTPDVRAAYLHNGESVGEVKDWWLRSPRLFTTSECAGKVFAYGSRRGMIGRQVVSSLGAARPAFWAAASSDLTQYKCDTNYKWAQDYSTCTAAVCFGDSPLMSETVATSSQITKEATESEEGIKAYTAHFTSPAFAEQTTTETIPKREKEEVKPVPTEPKEITDLAAVKISKPKAAKKKITVKWKKISKKNLKKIQGIEIQVALDKGFNQIVKNSKTGKKKTSNTIKGLKPKMTYWVRIRAYRNATDGKHVSPWKKKKVKLK